MTIMKMTIKIMVMMVLIFYYDNVGGGSGGVGVGVGDNDDDDDDDDDACRDTVSIYQRLHESGLQYGPAFRLLRNVHVPCEADYAADK